MILAQLKFLFVNIQMEIPIYGEDIFCRFTEGADIINIAKYPNNCDSWFMIFVDIV